LCLENTRFQRKEKTIVSVSSAGDTIALISIKASKQDPTPPYFKDIIFWVRKYLLVYSNMLMNFAKVAHSFTNWCLTRMSLVKWILMLIFRRQFDDVIRG